MTNDENNESRSVSVVHSLVHWLFIQYNPFHVTEMILKGDSLKVTLVIHSKNETYYRPSLTDLQDAIIIENDLIEDLNESCEYDNDGNIAIIYLEIKIKKPVQPYLQ